MPARFCTPTSVRTRTALLTTTLLMSGILWSGHAFAQGTALPSGGQVVAGAATIGGSGSQTVISQSSDKAIINWTDFSIGKGGEVTFNNGDGATLNRVTGGNLSSIDGLLNATGSVYLINPNGVIIGKTGVINVGGGFVASALDITNDNFLNGGDQTFSGPSLASVVNFGKIGALGGDVALMAVNVQNSGAIDAANGTAGLVAGRKIILRDSSVDDGKFLIVTGGSDTAVSNDGAIAAASAELRAEGGNIYALAGNTSGVIRATGVAEKDGKVWLTAGAGGSVNVSGSTITAGAANGDGGDITVTGGQVKVAASATLDASATTANGNGGTILAIADMTAGKLTFAGTALAKGGSTGGNGGFVETSGHAVDFAGARINTLSLNRSGRWLIDPENLVIDASNYSAIESGANSGTLILSTSMSGANDGLGGTGTGNSAEPGDIIINHDLTITNGEIVFDSYHSVQFNANVTANAGSWVYIFTNDDGGFTGTGGGSGGDYYFAQGKNLTFTDISQGQLYINDIITPYTLVNSLSGLQAINNTNGHYALVSDLSPGALASSHVITYLTQNSILTGLGHAIDGLTLTKTYDQAVDYYAGLVGENHGTIRDLGMTNFAMTITYNDYVHGVEGGGAIAGDNETTGVIKNVWVTGAAGGIVGAEEGGLVGYNYGLISNSYATIDVSSWGASGGLVAYNYGTIENTYATGNVISDTLVAGGLVGQNADDGAGVPANRYGLGGGISDSYSTGTVSGVTTGGLVGLNYDPYITGSTGTVTDSYWNKTTSGLASSAAGAALTTAQLQDGTLPSGFSSAWTASNGANPSLTTFNAPVITYQLVNGLVYTGSGALASGATVTLYSGGSLIGTSSGSGSDGAYSIQLADGTITSSTAIGGLLTLNGSSTVSGLVYTNAPTLSGGDVTGFDIHSGLIDLTTGASGYIALQNLLNTTFGTTNLSSALAAITNPDYKLTTSGAFTLDSDLTGGGAVAIKTGGDLTVNKAITVNGSKALTLDSHDNLYVNANLTASGGNAVTLKTANGGSGDYYFALGDSLSFTGSGGSLDINGNAYTLLYSLTDLAGVSGSGNYALAGSLDASGQTYSDAVVSEIQGIFTGLGHTVSNLKVSSSTDRAGLFGYNAATGTIRDIGVTGGSINGANDSGGLVGVNSGAVLNAYASADVSGTGDNIGGLVGSNTGSISNSFATGSAQGTFYIGGLVGLNDGAGSITNAFAMGSATASSVAGGLVGHMSNGTVDNVYATGYATGSNGLFGVVGGSAILTNAYFNTDTNTNLGIGYNNGGYSVTGLTTAQLQGSLPSGFTSSAWATGTGLYPYLKTFYPGGLQAITGTAKNGSGTAVAAAQVALYSGGNVLATTRTGVNGAYYIMETPGTVTASTELGGAVTLSGASGVSGLSYTNAPTLSGGNVTGFNIQSGLIDLTTGATSYSALQSRLSATFGSSTLSSALAGISSPNYRLAASGAFNFDQALTTSGELDLSAAGGITLSADLTAGGDATFNNAITLANDATLTAGGALTFASTINGAHSLTLKGGSLAFSGVVGGTTALTSLTGKATAGNISVGGQITTTGAILLVANGGFSNTAGASALNAGGDFTVYTQNASDPTGTMPVNSFGGLTATNYYNDAYNFTTGAFASTVPTGDHFVYAYAASLTPTLSGTATKTYDAALTADTTGLSVGGTLLSADDSVTFTIGSASYDTKNAGTGKTVTANVSLSSNPNNYTLDSSTASAAIGTIDKAALTLAAVTGVKTYDTTTTSSGTVTVSGLQGSDTVSGLTQSYDSKNAGARTLSVDGGYVISDGNSGGNYTVTTQTASGTINKAALTLAAVTGVKTYDATITSSGTVTVFGLQGSDTVSGLTQSYDSKNAGSRTLSVNGGYVINDGNSGGNYTVTTQTAAGAINKAALTLAAVTGTKTYDATTTSSGTVTVSGLQGSDTVSGLTQSYDSKNAGSRTLSVNGGYVISDGNSGGNYTVTTQTAAGTINKAALTLAAVTGTKTYDATTTSSGTVSVSGLQGSDTVSGLSQSYDSKNAGARTLSVNGGYVVNDGNSGGNYTVTTQTAAGTINKAALTLAAVTGTKTYDTTTTSSGTVSVSGLQGSDTVSDLSQSYDSKNAGARTLSVNGGYVVSDGNSGGNYTITTQTAAGTINKATLVASLTGAAVKTYDATTDADLTNTNYSLTGVLGSDDVTLNDPSSGNYADRNAGTGKAVSVSGLALSGGDAGNYTVNSSASGNIGTINRAALTLAAVTGTKTYDATTTSSGTVSVSGLQGSDTVSGLTQSYDSKNAGARTLSVDGGYVISDGNNGGNYTVTTQTTAGTINKAALTLAAVTGTKTYDATTTSSGTVSVSGLQGSDTVTGLTQSYDSKNAGSRTLGIDSGYVVNDGNNGGNYTITTQTASGTINKAALTLAAVSGTRTYDATTTSAGTVSITGLQGSDTVTGLSQSYDSKNAGSRMLGVNSGYVVNDGNGGGNYTVTTQTASGTIDKAVLVAGLTGTVVKTYDATTDADLTSANYSLSGVFGSDDVALNDPSSGSYADKNAGTSKTVSVSGLGLSGSDAGNYMVNSSTAAAIGTINRAALTLAAVTGTKTYDTTTTSSGTVSVSGLQGSDTVSGLSQSYDSKNAGSRTLSVNGGYVISDGNSGGNYTVTTQTAAGTINKAALTLAAVTGTKTYDATTTSSGTVTVSGLQGSDTVSGLTQSYDSKNAGSRTLSVNGGYVISDGNSGGNYTVTTQTASGTIDKATLVAGLTGIVGKTYDATTDASLTNANYSLTGVLGSDDVTLNDPASGSYADRNAGTGKAVSVSGLALSGGDAGNYTVNTSATGNVGTINQAALTLAAVTGTRTYDTTTSSGGTVTVSGLQGSDTVTGLSQSYDSKNAGSRTLAVNGGYVVNDGNGGGNYTITTQTASGTIDKATLVAGLTGAVVKTYDATTDADLTSANYSLTGVLGADDVALNAPSSGSYADQNASTGKTVSVSGLGLSGSDAGNYTVNSSASGAIGTIDKRAIAIAADDAGKITGDADPLLTWQMTLGSLAGSDTITGGLTRASGETPGDYAITQGSLAASDNYSVTFTGAKFTIAAAGMQNEPTVNPVQSSLAPPVTTTSTFTDTSGSGGGSSASGNDAPSGGNASTTDGGTSGGNAGAGDPDATGPDTNGNSSSSTTCIDGGACANQPYPGNQTFSSYVSFLSQ